MRFSPPIRGPKCFALVMSRPTYLKTFSEVLLAAQNKHLKIAIAYKLLDGMNAVALVHSSGRHLQLQALQSRRTLPPTVSEALLR